MVSVYVIRISLLSSFGVLIIVVLGYNPLMYFFFVGYDGLFLVDIMGWRSCIMHMDLPNFQLYIYEVKITPILKVEVK